MSFYYHYITDAFGIKLLCIDNAQHPLPVRFTAVCCVFLKTVQRVVASSLSTAAVSNDTDSSHSINRRRQAKCRD